MRPVFLAPFPLTPALSPGEREDFGLRWKMLTTRCSIPTGRKKFPLPEGEG
jgi:hypothetical protein